METTADVTFTAGIQVALGDGFGVKDGASFTAGTDASKTPQVESRSYSYQDFQYFLTGDDGPWGSLGSTQRAVGGQHRHRRVAVGLFHPAS